MPATIGLIPPAAAADEPLAALLREVSPAPPGVPPRLWEAALAGPVTEFLGRPGKRFRGRLVALAWALAGRRDEPPPALTLLVELLHAGSLIVDDIEDGSIQRRGRAALHRLVGLPVALNAGNWLYFWPMTLLRGLGLPGPVELELHRLMAEAVRRCHEGQALDLTARIGDLHPSEVRALARVIGEWKTGSLMALAAELGAASAGAGPDLVSAVGAFGNRVGVGLQMQNDLSELTGAAGPVKHPEDLIHGRVTWPWAWAAERLPAARFDALQVRGALLSEGSGDAAALARDLLAALGPDPRRPIRDRLAGALADLRAEVGPSPALGGIEAELARLETRYA
jgi:geranylgeranyl pyrophosphate synthase